jgi:hypothetical protein
VTCCWLPRSAPLRRPCCRILQSQLEPASKLEHRLRSADFDVDVSVVFEPVWLVALCRLPNLDSAWRPTTETNPEPLGGMPHYNTEPTDGSVRRMLHIPSANSVDHAATGLAK